MQNFLLYSGERYSYKGGHHDLVAHSSTLEHAIFIKDTILTGSPSEWWHIVDFEKGLIVEQSFP